MVSAYQTPAELVEAMHTRAPQARIQFHALLARPITRLLSQILSKHNRLEDLEHLSLHALHSAETFVRMKSRQTFAELTWSAFRATVLVYLAKIVSQPYGHYGRSEEQLEASEKILGTSPLPFPESVCFDTRTFFRPYERLGNNWFGGDWYAGHSRADSLWVIVADVTGHGYFAYLLACALPEIWSQTWQRVNTKNPHDPHPVDVLTEMHHTLADCLPEGVFLECTLARLDHDGGLTVVPAGGTQLLVRRHRSSRPNQVRLRGFWLGLAPPAPGEHHRDRLGPGDELLLATDGIYDHLGDQAGAELANWPEDCSLLDVIQDRLHRILEEEPQRDDLTMVHLRRRDRAGDVSV